MVDRNMLIKGAEEILSYVSPSEKDASVIIVKVGWIRDVLTMLKEQEAVEPKKESEDMPEKWASWWYVCGNCGREIDWHDRYCRHCGRSVKWNE